MPPPLVVTLDLVRLKDAGISDDALLGQAIQDAVTASGANLVLRQEAIRASSERSDITDQVIARVKKTASEDHPAAKAFAPRLEVLDMAAAKKFGATEDETAINDAAARWMKDTKANLVLDKQAVVVGTDVAADVTGNVIGTITHSPSQTTPRPFQGRIMLLDRMTLLQSSKAGQDVSRQAQAYVDAAKQELGQRQAALEKMGNALKEDLPTLSAEEKATRLKVFKDETDAIQAAARAEDAQIRDGVEQARHVMERALEPVLSKMMMDHGAAIVLDRQATCASFPGLDVTNEAIEKLDAVLGGVPVTVTGQPAATQAN